MKKITLLIFITIFILFSFKEKNEQLPYTDIPSLDSTNLHEGLYLPKGFTATVWAESPQFFNPTNMDIDERGRVWITEAVNYRNFNNDSTKFLHHAGGDRVMILEDTDGDGKSDKSKVFVEDKDLISPLGVAVIGNKVIVSCSPSLIVYTDENGDDKPDSKDIYLTGFGGKDHDHSLHSLVAGPDGKWYFNVGNAGPHIVKDKAGWNLRSGSLFSGGSPYNTENKTGMLSDDGKLWVGGLGLRINPDGTGLEVMAHNFRNAYELALDSYGNMWQNDNDDQIVTCRTSFVMEGGNAGYFSSDGTRYWGADRRPGQSAFTAQWHQEDPGVTPACDNTGSGSPTGMVVYEGDAFGEQFRGMLLSCEAGKNVIFGYKPKALGAGFELNRKNFISSVKAVNDNYKWDEEVNSKEKWFRPSDIAVGPDGSIFIADWYDPIVGGHKMDDYKGFGRIYRITPIDKKLQNPKIDLKSVNGQIEALLNPAINVRNLGFRALAQEGEKVVPQVKDILRSTNSFHKARAIWLLAQLGEKGNNEVRALLKDSDSDVRLVAFRALKQNKKELISLADQLATDPSPAVRREVAIALRDASASESLKDIVTLAKQFDGKDRWYLEALGTASYGKEEQAYTAIKEQMGAADPLAWSKTFEGINWRLHPTSSVADLKARASSSKILAEDRKKALVALGFIKTPESAKSMLDLTSSPLADVKEQAHYWVKFRKSNDWFSLYDWSKIDFLKDKDLEVSKEIKKLQVKLLNNSLPIKERKAVAAAMAKDPAGGKMLVKLASDKKLSKEVMVAIAEVIFNNPDQGVRVLASDYFERPGGVKSFSITNISKMKGDAIHGKSVFTSKCTSCHKIGETGNNIGPDLTNIYKKFDKSGLLDAVINPSAALAFGFEPWLITMEDGSVIYGFLLSEGNTMVIKDIGGKQHVLDISKIKDKKQLPTSIMPDPNGLALSNQDLSDISTYLLNLGKD